MKGGAPGYGFLGAAMGAFFAKNPPKKGKTVPRSFTPENGKC